MPVLKNVGNALLLLGLDDVFDFECTQGRKRLREPNEEFAEFYRKYSRIDGRKLLGEIAIEKTQQVASTVPPNEIDGSYNLNEIDGSYNLNEIDGSYNLNEIDGSYNPVESLELAAKNNNTTIVESLELAAKNNNTTITQVEDKFSRLQKEKKMVVENLQLPTDKENIAILQVKKIPLQEAEKKISQLEEEILDLKCQNTKLKQELEEARKRLEPRLKVENEKKEKLSKRKIQLRGMVERVIREKIRDEGVVKYAIKCKVGDCSKEYASSQGWIRHNSTKHSGDENSEFEVIEKKDKPRKKM